MDLEEWELLSDDGFIEFHEDGGKNNFHRKHNSSVPKSVFNMNYFIYPTSSSPPTPPPKKFIKSPENPQFIKQPENPQNQIVAVPIQLDPSLGKTQEDHHPPPPRPPILGGGKGDSSSMEGDQDQDDQDTIPHVFFIKMKENEFVDMKMDSPKSSISTNSRIMHQFDSGAFGGDAAMDIIKPSSPKMIKNTTMDSDTQKEEEEVEATWEEEEEEDNNKNNNNGGLNIWKWSCNGIGAICSFGVAAATICILILGSSNSSSQSNIKHHQQNQKLRFQIYADDRRIKQVVHHATKLNDAISAVRGVPFTRAHITFGGYYDGL